MEWQEYQEAAAILYEQAEGIGVVCRNVLLPDKVTGPRAIKSRFLLMLNSEKINLM